MLLQSKDARVKSSYNCQSLAQAYPPGVRAGGGLRGGGGLCGAFPWQEVFFSLPPLLSPLAGQCCRFLLLFPIVGPAVKYCSTIHYTCQPGNATGLRPFYPEMGACAFIGNIYAFAIEYL